MRENDLFFNHLTASLWLPLVYWTRSASYLTSTSARSLSPSLTLQNILTGWPFLFRQVPRRWLDAQVHWGKNTLI